MKMTPRLSIEKEHGFPQKKIVGVDEVGRGCLAGPVYAAAVVLPEDINTKKYPWILQITDSKCVAKGKREELSKKIQSWAREFCVAWASVEEIDQINIFHASHLAMVRAVQGLNTKIDHVLVDGKFLPKNVDFKQTAVIQGDKKSLAIASASILAKVARDQQMDQLELDFPGYGLSKHKGYPTPFHKKMLIEKGPSEIHRRSFRPVSELLL